MTPKDKILDIAMNLNRIGNWAADDYYGKEKRITTFLGNTTQYINSLNKQDFNEFFGKTYKTFLKEYKKLEKEAENGPSNPLYWAEQMMTWGNILTHRSKLI